MAEKGNETLNRQRPTGLLSLSCTDNAESLALSSLSFLLFYVLTLVSHSHLRHFALIDIPITATLPVVEPTAVSPSLPY